MNAGTFSSHLFQMVCFFQEKVRMCLKGTGLLTKLTSGKAILFSQGGDWVFIQYVSFPDLFLAFILYPEF